MWGGGRVWQGQSPPVQRAGVWDGGRGQVCGVGAERQCSVGGPHTSVLTDGLNALAPLITRCPLPLLPSPDAPYRPPRHLDAPYRPSPHLMSPYLLTFGFQAPIMNLALPFWGLGLELWG